MKAEPLRVRVKLWNDRERMRPIFISIRRCCFRLGCCSAQHRACLSTISRCGRRADETIIKFGVAISMCVVGNRESNE